MPAYIQETGRSFPNPIKGGGFNQEFKRPSSGNYDTSSDYPGQGLGMAYSITFEDGGPGSMPMGKDNVHYIGDEEPTNVNASGNERVGIYRFYRAAKDDHKYSRDPQLIKRDFGCENESWQRAASGYNPEPRKGSPVMYIMFAQVPNSVPLKAFYSYWPDDTQLCAGTNVPTGLQGVGCGRNKYKEVDTLGYVFTSEADALTYCSPGETPVPIYEYLHPDPDHFYTIDPSVEVRLADNSPIPPKESLDKSYSYLGIVGWGFKTRALDSPTDLILDIGKIGPTGQCVDKSDWYDYSWGDQLDYDEDGGGWSEFMYRQMRDSSGASIEGPPNVNGWGWPDNVDVENEEALFEWSYGLSGAVKGAVPRFLGFEDSYDSQFVFYLYDSTYPWNGPIFSSQYILSNAQCCPNTTDPEGCPHCAPVWTYHSHFYEINADVWNTTKTKLSLHDASSVGVNESFWTVDTETPIVFFRYTTRTGDFSPGEKINGWDVVSVYYFGDELKCGIMELTWDNSNDNKWYVNPAAIAWRITDNSNAEITNSITERGAWLGVGTPNNPANGWTSHMKSYGIYPVIPADDAIDPNIGVWQVHTATFTIATAGDYSLRIESDNYGYMKITDSGSSVLVDREITYANGMGGETFPMTLGAGTYTLETRVKNISREVDPEIFQYEEQFTSSDGGTAEILAGYGIPNKSAFCGTYEFPKKISYWKVEIDPKALIPHRNMDEAKLEAIVDDDGSISQVVVVNGGRGYVNPTIKVMDPQGLDDFSPNDSSSFMADKLGMDPEAEKAIADPDKEDTSMSTADFKTHARIWESSTTSVDTEDKNNDLYKLQRAEVEISLLDDQGIIRSVRVIDGGAGYSQANNPIVHVVDPEKIKFEGVEDKEGNFQAGGKEMKEASEKMDSAWDHTFEKKDVVYGIRDEATLDDYTMQPISSTIDQEGSQTRSIVKEAMNYDPNAPANNATQVYVEVPDSYIRAAADGIDDDVTKLCFNLPASCIEINGNANLPAAMPDQEQFQFVSAAEPGVKEFEDNAMGYAYNAVSAADTFGSNMSHLYGPFGQDKCIEVVQPKLYNITRWFDMPCAYLDTNEEGERKAFGWLPYKYCASKDKEATFRVSMEIEGYVGGTQGPAFMDFLKDLPVPFLQEKRPITTNAGEKTWKCKRSSIDGRCYRDPQDPGNMVFVPVGLDENTYDYNRSNFTELEQLQMWAGQNITSSAAVQTWLGHPTAGDPAGTPHSVDYTALTVAACTNNVPPNECWDTYVRGVNASDGPLTVYCGYDADGNGLTGQTYCQVSQLQPSNTCLALDKCMDASIAVNPQRISGSGSDARMLMGAYNGTMTVRNWLTGGVIALGRGLKNYGNPFFDECQESDSWTDGTGLNEIVFPKRL
tara:strand:- start:28 stop:4167 length:4140 start_codon:yes stop_codon:yes gene_type:complete